MPTKKRGKVDPGPEALLVQQFRHNGYMRVPNEHRRDEEPGVYKKGYEIRFVAQTYREILDIRQILRRAGIRGGKPFRKNTQWIQPVYGKQIMEQFNEWLATYG